MKNVFWLTVFFFLGVGTAYWYFSENPKPKTTDEKIPPPVEVTVTPSPKPSPVAQKYNLPEPPKVVPPSPTPIPSPIVQDVRDRKAEERGNLKFLRFAREKKLRTDGDHFFNPILSQQTFSIGGIIYGTVRYAGQPISKPIQMSADPACKNDGAVTEDVLTTDGGLQDTLIYIKEDVRWAGPEFQLPPVSLVQRGCVYRPHTLGLMVNQTLQIANQDATLHNIHTNSKSNPSFNLGQAGTNLLEKKFSKPEIPIKVRCDVHGWMNASIGVFSHPFFSISSALGVYAIRGLPPGTYTVETWHPKLGTRSQKVTIKAIFDASQVDFNY